MELRKRQKPTVTLAMQREALISRTAKRQCYGYAKPPSRQLPIAGSRGAKASKESHGDHEPESDLDPDFQAPRAYRRAGGERGRGGRACTDRGLTFLQTAHLSNIPVRSGKWNEAEELYLRKLVSLFNAGLLDDADARPSLRMWLSTMLGCCPMRISKKQSHGEKFKGKSKYSRNRDRIAKMTQKEFLQHWWEVGTLRANFLYHWARDEYSKWCPTTRGQEFEDWYETIVDSLPTPMIAMNPSHTKPTQAIPMPMWQTIRREFMSMESKKAVQRVLQLSEEASESEQEMEDESEDESEEDTEDGEETENGESEGFSSQYSQYSQYSALDDRSLCQESCCTISEADMALLANEEFSEPTELYEMELSVDAWAADQEVWEVCEITPTKSRGADIHSGIVLDFGPPSLWSTESTTKDTLPPRSSEWVDDLLSEDTLLMLADNSHELLYEPWASQLRLQL